MFTLLPLAWVMVNMPRTAANRELIYTLHKSLGLTVLALVAVRLILRAIHPAPQVPRQLGAVGTRQRRVVALATLSHHARHATKRLSVFRLGRPRRHLFRAVHAPWSSEERYAAAGRILGARRHRSMADLCCHTPPYWSDRLARGGTPGWSAIPHAARAKDCN